MMHETSDQLSGWRRAVWLCLLVASSVAFSLAFACATPFAAFAALGVCTLPRRDAYALSIGVWLANQAVGFGCLGYPWTSDCLMWGLILGLSALLATCAADAVVGRVRSAPSVVAFTASLVAGFVAYEVVLIASSAVLGGLHNYTFAIQGRIFGINALAFVGLMALNRIGNAIGIASNYRARSPVASRVA